MTSFSVKNYLHIIFYVFNIRCFASISDNQIITMNAKLLITVIVKHKFKTTLNTPFLELSLVVINIADKFLQ